MKKMMILAMMMVMTVSANAMSYNAAKNEALFLSDKMAYELNLTPAQFEAVYEINLDYLLSVDNGADLFGIWWNRRNMDLKFVLTPWQYDRYMTLNYFYRPVSWTSGNWVFSIYSHYHRSHFYFDRPKVFVSYRGGNNHKGDRFYADRHVNKPSVNHGFPTAHQHKPSVKNDNKTLRGFDNKTSRGFENRTSHGFGNKNATVNVNNGFGHRGGNVNRNTSNRQMAQNTTVSRNNHGHFGGHR